MAALLTCHYFYNSNAHENNSNPKRVYTPKTNQNPDLILKPRISNSTRASKTLKSLLRQNNSSLIRALSFYVDSGSIENALSLFENMNRSDTFVWNVVIRGLTDNGYYEGAIDLYHRMEREFVRPDNFTFPFVIKACAESYALWEGQKVHAKL